MDSILVTPEELQKKAVQVDEEAANYYNEYQKLLNEVRDFTSSDYQGEDAKAFCLKVEGFEPEFSKMKQLMNEYANFLKQAAQNYLNTQDSTKGAISSLR